MKSLPFLFACLLLSSVSRSRIITVDNDGPADFDTIQAAIDDANDGDRVVVNPGTYTGDGNREIDFKGKAKTVRSTDPNDPNIVATTIIDCEQKGRGFYLSGCERAVISGLTITNGLAQVGAGIYCKDSSVTISQCRIGSNRTMRDWADLDPNSGNGAGLYFCSASATIIHCTISDNQTASGGSLDWEGTEGADGGGVYCNNSNVELRHCGITGNRTGDGGSAFHYTSIDGGSGAGIYSAGSTVTIQNCHISDNEAGKGGESIGGAGNGGNGAGVYCDASSTLEIHDSIVINNLAGDGNSDMGSGWRGGSGAGLYCASTTPLELTGCTISGNMTGRGGGSSYSDDSGDGGGIWCRSAVIENCQVLGNRTADGVDGEGRAGRAGHGAGIYCQDSLSLSRTTISRNQTGSGLGGIDMPGKAGNGAGIYCNGPATIQQCQIVANTTGHGSWTDYTTTPGGDGGGIYCAGPLSVVESLICGNRTGYGGGDPRYPGARRAGAAGGSGAGVFCAGPATIRQCTIFGNQAGLGGRTDAGDGADGRGAAICSLDRTSVVDSIVWRNLPEPLSGHDCNSVTHSNIDDEACIGGAGNISADPCFIQPGYWADAGDPNIVVEPNAPNAVWIMGGYHLSQIAAGQAVDSPCVDAGSDTAVNLGMDRLTTRTDKVGDEGIVDIGYHYCENIADLNDDGKVNVTDLVILASQWQQGPRIPSADIAPTGGDGLVDGRDLGVFADNWRWQQ